MYTGGMNVLGRTQLDPDEDARLAARCLAGDEKAWEALVRRHEGLVYSMGRSYRVSDEDLAEVFQDVFLALYQRLPYIRDTRALCRWLASTAERVARSTALRRRREFARQDDEGGDLAALPAPDADPARGIEELETQALVRLGLEDLSARCRELLQALYYEDPPVPYATLAGRLRMSIGSIGPTRARCFDRLRTSLERRGAVEGITSPLAPTSSPDTDAGGPRPLASSTREEGGEADET